MIQLNRRHVVLPAVVIPLLLVGCDARQSKSVTDPSDFSSTNVLSDGETFHVVRSVFGLAIVPSRSNVVIRFGSNGIYTVVFDPLTLKPLSTMMHTEDSQNMSGQIIADLNADGMPDMRQVKGNDHKEVYYLGKWYDAQETGSNYLVTFEEGSASLCFDGQQWQRTSSNR